MAYVMLDMTINDGIVGATSKISKGIRDYVIENEITTISAIKLAAEVEIVRKVQKYAFKPKRVKEVLDDKNL